MKPIPAIILVPLIVHPIWAVLMLTSRQPLHTMGLDSAYKVTTGAWAATMLMFGSSIFAWLSHMETWHGNIKGFGAIIPQQFLMLLSAWTIITCTVAGQYANGYAPPEGWRFIATDQIFFFVACILHSKQVWRTYIQLLNGQR